MDAVEVRRAYLTNGANVPLTAAQLGISRALVYYYVRKATRQAPLTYQKGEQADREAMAAYVRACLDRANITYPHGITSTNKP